ncbi:MAG: sensor histidine kinase [Anaerolineae bacterium]
MSLKIPLISSIQVRLLAVSLFTTFLTVTIVVAFNQWLRVQLVAEADTALLVTASQMADRVDEFNRSNMQVFNVGSRLPDLVDFLQASEEQRQDSAFRNRTLITLDSLEIEPWDEYYILSQAILDRSGRNILDTAMGNMGGNESQQEYFRAALLGGSIAVSPVQFRPDRAGIYYNYAVPLRSPDPPNTVIGVLRIQISLSSVQNILFEAVHGDDLDVMLFDKNQVRLADNRHEDLLFRSVSSFSTEEIAAFRAQYAIPPLPDQYVSVPIPSLAEALTTTHNREVLSGYTTPGTTEEARLAIVQLTTMPWSLVVAQPAAQYYQTVQQQTTGILVLAISLTVLSLVSSFMVSRRITRPIRTLTAIARQVGEGKLYIKAPVASRDEVGTLATTFNLMTTELELVHSTLEERVEQRTLELSEANEKLKHEMAERERAEQQALDFVLEHERTRILTEFIQDASHEFKTPLSIINVNTHLTKRLLPDEQKRLMIAIEEQTRYIDGLVNRMVLMSKLDSGLSSHLLYVKLDDFLRTIHSSLSETIKVKQAAVHLDLNAPTSWVYADPDLLFIAVQNLFDNALKYTKPPIEIHVSTTVQGDRLVVVIKDNGIGIPQEFQARVFERFFRVDEAHSTRGFGLGLPIAKRIIENLGGTIDLVSEVSKGTTVTVKLCIETKK